MVLTGRRSGNPGSSSAHSDLLAGVALENIWFAGLGFAAVLVEDVITTEDVRFCRTSLTS